MEINESLAETRSQDEVSAIGRSVRGDLLTAKELLAQMKYFTNIEEKVIYDHGGAITIVCLLYLHKAKNQIAESATEKLFLSAETVARGDAALDFN
ncbi:iron-sulfur cluster co-chaperone mitochondrial-like protein [Labeo rohita]|uniref:Iron-sulfur cluster co-chaperone mitochondrial-like protein n=1 Tax=Labeo rohita TaxID=84645 RepID=A0A498N2J5_LABRO|nr:iron-sulfur cluster co-chaperone mitochondrial-like protein [Labeo rohita]RXN28784.1 iron-sulfur cluster co-chaperone mitochondrial-like protein [Labeo rohita]